jgi:cytochrome c biogenesis protein CcmG/thiol:disulfide interchange protein DsbE
VETQKNNSKSWPISILAAVVLIGSYFGIQRFFGDLDDKLVEYERFEIAPAFDLPLQKLIKPDGLAGKKTVTLADLKGHTVLLHFWASWCAPCREEKPILAELVKKHQDGSMIVIGVSSYETEVALRASGMLEDAPFTVLLDEEGTTAVSYKVRAIPQSVLIDGEGRVRYRVKGQLNAQEIAALDDVLKSMRTEKKASTAAVNL